MSEKLNPITVEIIRNAFQSAAEEMCVSLFRSSYTPIIYEMKDCAVALYDENLNVLGQSSGVPLFLGNLDETVRYAINYFGGKENFNEGDIYILNDSYISGTHLNDVTVFAPIIFDDELVGFSANRAHWLDVGSKDPLAPMDSDSIFQEGIRIGPTKIYDRGVPRQDVIDLICMNSRFKRNAHGDLNGMIAGCRTGDQRLHVLINRFGMPTIRQAIREIFEQTAQLEREFLQQIPPGVYVEEGILDNDGVVDEPLTVKLTLTVDEDHHMTVDLTGSSPQAKGSTNTALAQTISAVRVAYKELILPNIPITGGSFRGLTVTCPEGTIFTAKEPAAFSWYFSHLGLLIDLMIKAVGQAVPKFSAGAHYGDSMVCYLTYRDPETGILTAHDEPTVGGWGGFYEGDGQDCMINVQNGDFKNFPAEICEHLLPCIMEKYEIRQDSEGAGKNRGGCGVIRTYRTLADGVNLYLWFDRSKMPAWGVEGGQGAKGPKVTVYDENGNVVMEKLKLNNWRMGKDWLVVMETGGGGGYGDPLERDPVKVEYDVQNYFVSKERAEKAYGVVIDENGCADLAATECLRAKMKAAR